MNKIISIFEKLGYSEKYVYRNAILNANKKYWLKEWGLKK